MSEKDQKGQPVDEAKSRSAGAGSEGAQKNRPAAREDRLAEALRANLRRRKSAAKSRKDG
ncbi:hypothetical protein [Roseibium sp. Sym1]|uniref:hypothetical protein n=1 Tax=Roseibium sp. Sym1 TaxID=3016006 RepID=UPI0022B2AF87|nr:hypothetical protein [Roseibium sp. Sym1]